MSREPDNTEKDKIVTKRVNEELKNLDKIMKKETNDMEDLAGPGATNAKAVYDRAMKTLNNMRKITKEHNRIKHDREHCTTELSESKKAIEGCIKKKKMLSMICDQFMNQNFDLYLAHEKMLDDEKQKREELGQLF